MNRKAGNHITAIRLCAVLLLVSLTLPVGADSGQQAVDRIGQIMSARYPPGEPGAALLVARDDEVVFRGAFGLASMELGVPVTPEMVFGLASITKLFTALGAMMLVEEGALELDDEVVEFLPELEKTKGVTIAHLLSHTSGMTGPVSEIPGYPADNFHRAITSRELIESYAPYELKFQPGTQFQYSNEGVATLARIIEIVSGQTWEEFLQERIFRPVGMTSTHYAGHDRIIPMSVTGYTEHEEEWKRARYTSFTRGFGMGALFSNVDDLYAWYEALLSGRLVSTETLAAMLTPYPLTGGGHSRHGLGFVVTFANGHKLVGHGGSHIGWSTFLMFVPDEKIFITVLTNSSSDNGRARRDALDILRVLLAPPRTGSGPDPRP
ncbi:serine hydrolase domain-containing protein [Elongatibacter sediminis]|uniref:Serine hydrolase domain-containing protein n=1 Tax=Elongatibacter sediminis TaxID=3119006 RepID=A0AAW9R8Q9_9GAMM